MPSINEPYLPPIIQEVKINVEPVYVPPISYFQTFTDYLPKTNDYGFPEYTDFFIKGCYDNSEEMITFKINNKKYLTTEEEKINKRLEELRKVIILRPKKLYSSKFKFKTKYSKMKNKLVYMVKFFVKKVKKLYMKCSNIITVTIDLYNKGEVYILYEIGLKLYNKFIPKQIRNYIEKTRNSRINFYNKVNTKISEINKFCNKLIVKIAKNYKKLIFKITYDKFQAPAQKSRRFSRRFPAQKYYRIRIKLCKKLILVRIHVL